MLFRSLRLHHREMQGYSKKTEGLWLPNLPYKTWILEHNVFLEQLLFLAHDFDLFYLVFIYWWTGRGAASLNQNFLLFNLDEKEKTGGTILSKERLALSVLDHYILSCLKKNFTGNKLQCKKNWRRILYYVAFVTPQWLHCIGSSHTNKYSLAIKWN